MLQEGKLHTGIGW
jgi:hypothetical protein